MAFRVLLAGSGSGGHVYPLIAVAQALKTSATQQNIPLELQLIGNRGFIEKAAAENQIPFRTIVAGKLRRYASASTFSDVLRFPVGFLQSLWHVFWFMPDVIFAKGGYDSVPVAILGWLYSIPVYVHESDAIPGLSNRIIAKFAKKIFISFPSAAAQFKGKETLLTGNPVRLALAAAEPTAAHAAFSLASDIKTILVVGGSQGSKAINDFIMSALVLLIEKYQIIHQCGESQFNAVRAEVGRITTEGAESYGGLVAARHKLFPFLNQEEMANAYAAADIIISRAGAASIFEIALAGKPAILVPITASANSHQAANAAEFTKYGVVVIEEQNLTPNLVLNQIENLIARAGEISTQLRTFATPNAAATIAAVLLETRN